MGARLIAPVLSSHFQHIFFGMASIIVTGYPYVYKEFREVTQADKELLSSPGSTWIPVQTNYRPYAMNDTKTPLWQVIIASVALFPTTMLIFFPAATRTRIISPRRFPFNNLRAFFYIIGIVNSSDLTTLLDITDPSAPVSHNALNCIIGGCFKPAFDSLMSIASQIPQGVFKELTNPLYSIVKDLGVVILKRKQPSN